MKPGRTDAVGRTSILIQFEDTDAELLAALETSFPGQHDVLKVRHFDAGVQDILQAVVPMGTTLVGFLATYFAVRTRGIEKKRLLISKKGEISLEGFSVAEIEQLLSRVSES